MKEGLDALVTISGIMDSSSASASIRVRIKALFAEREAMEAEMAAIAQRLTSAPGSPGLRGPLVDAEGFPVSGVDLYAVRGDRGRYAVLRNDHNAVTGEIERAMAELHANAAAGVREGVARIASLPPASKRGQPSEPTQFRVDDADGNGNGGVCMESTDASIAPLTPAFAVIDEVMEGSPAHAAGLQVGDQVVAFGGVTSGVGGSVASILPRVAALLAENEGTVLSVRVLRRGEIAELVITPQRWDGRGLLGCHMRPR